MKIVLCLLLLSTACGCQTLRSYSDYRAKRDANCECAWTCPAAWGSPMESK